MEKILNKIMVFLSKEEELDSEQAEIVRYGLEILLLKSIFFLAPLALGLLIGCFWACFLFMAFFVPLRSFAGGYHADTRKQCLIQSMLTTLLVLSIIKWSADHPMVLYPLLLLALLSAGCIWMLAPIDTENKRLDASEQQLFKKRTRCMLLIECGFVLILYVLALHTGTCAAMLSISTTGILLSAERLKQMRKKHAT